MKFEDLSNQYKGRHLEFKLKPGAKIEKTVFPIGIAKALSMKQVVKEMMKEKVISAEVFANFKRTQRK